MGWIDDGVEVLDAEHAEVGDRETASLVLVRRQLAVARECRQFLHLGGQGRERLQVRVPENRREQAAFNGHGDGRRQMA